VLSRGGNRTPIKGSRVKVKGVVRDVAVFNGMPLGCTRRARPQHQAELRLAGSGLRTSGAEPGVWSPESGAYDVIFTATAVISSAAGP